MTRLRLRRRRVPDRPGEPPCDCADVARRISAFLDGELDPGTAATIVDHLGRCRDCPPEAAALASLRSALRDLGAPPPEALQRLRAWAETIIASAPEGGLALD